LQYLLEKMGSILNLPYYTFHGDYESNIESESNTPTTTHI